MGKGDTFDEAYEQKDDIEGGLLSPFKYKFVPPLLPGRESTLHQLKHTVDTYLCKDCCSHKLVRMASTLHGSFDIIESYAGSTPTIMLPRSDAVND
jgi:hypothetical protein